MKILTGLAIVTDNTGKKIAYTHTTVNNEGIISESNTKESYIVMDKETLDIIEQLENKVKLRLL